jgi:SAM-dependent methyltransferase
MLDYERIHNFYEQHRNDRSHDPDFLRGTIEQSRGVALFRNRAEARHLARILRVEPEQRVLDLGAGTGRWSIFFAERGARVTAVEIAGSLAAGASENAERLGLPLDCRVGSILEPPLAADELFDIVHIGNTLLYIHDADLARVRDVVRKHLKPGALLVLREPVDPAGPSQQHSADYAAIMRRPERYVELFDGDFRLLYQRTTVSHLIPRGSSTTSVVSNMRRSSWRKPLIDRVLPLLGYIDYGLLQLEEKLRASPLAMLLGDAGVVQNFYVFTRTNNVG